MRSERNSGTTKIGWGGLAPKTLEKQTDAGVVVGTRRPASRGQAGKAQLSRSHPHGTHSVRPRQETGYLFPIFPLRTPLSHRD